MVESLSKIFLISDHNFKPIAIGGLGQGYQGDLIALTSVGRFLIPIWMDNSTGIYQLWTTRVDLNQLVNVENENLSQIEFMLEQNYPNPFNGFTKIKFRLRSDSKVRLEVIDLLGNVIEILVDEFLKKGEYEKIFSPKDLPSGVYFYRLNDGQNIKTRKLVYLK